METASLFIQNVGVILQVNESHDRELRGKAPCTKGRGEDIN